MKKRMFFLLMLALWTLAFAPFLEVFDGVISVQTRLMISAIGIAGTLVLYLIGRWSGLTRE